MNDILDPATAEVTLSDAAAARIAQLIDRQGNPDLKFRLSVSGGGCSGFQYGFALDETVGSDDVIIRNGTVAMLVDNTSLSFVAGAVVDYVETLGAAAFQVRNPNAQSSCGCGSSFSV